MQFCMGAARRHGVTKDVRVTMMAGRAIPVGESVGGRATRTESGVACVRRAAACATTQHLLGAPEAPDLAPALLGNCPSEAWQLGFSSPALGSGLNLTAREITSESSCGFA